MNRIDLQWQARWEMLKVALEGAAQGTGIDSVFASHVLSRMADLEKVDRPCLSRATVDYRSPMTGDPRAVFDPLPVLPELPEKKALEEKG